MPQPAALEPLPSALHGERLQLLAPAKINLALNVLGRREDGYHELESLFLPLRWADGVTLGVQPSSQVEVSCHCPGRPELDGTDNLAARAAQRWLEAHQRVARVEIIVDKQIWVAAGLGGGSSDAGAVLRGLERLWPTSDGDLPALALSLGADVPFFLHGRPALARGVGEKLTPLEGQPRELPLVLINPNLPLSTPAVFSALGLVPGARQEREPLPTSLPHNLKEIAALVRNDLEAPAIGLCAEIEQMKAALMDAGALVAGLSGSGPTVFGLFETPAEADQAASTISTIHGFSTVSTLARVA